MKSLMTAIKRLTGTKTCYFCEKDGYYERKVRVAESPKDFEGGGILVPVCNRCYYKYDETDFR